MTKITNLRAKAKNYGFKLEELLRSALKSIDYLELLRYSNFACEIEHLENFFPDNATYDYPIDLKTKPTTKPFPATNLCPFQTEGDSMVTAGIFDGDVVLVETGKFQSGEIAVVRLFDKFL